MKQRKILILTSRFGNGHYSVAEALAEHYTQQGFNTTILDVIEVILPRHYKTIYEVFNNVICRNIKLYNFCNSFGRNPRTYKPNKKLIQKITNLSPDRIVITWSGCCKTLASTGIPVTVCVTDMGLHSGWIYKNADMYLVASDDVADKLCQLGINKSIIKVTGIPVKKAFHNNIKVETTKRNILIMGGGLGIIPWLPDVLDSLSQQKDLEITIITGKNKKLRTYLSKNYPTVKAIGFTFELHKYLAKADLVLSKPGGVSIFESIHMGTPFIAVSPEYDHEIENANFLLKNHIGTVIRKDEVTPKRILDIINDQEYLNSCRYQMLKLKKSLL